MDNENNDRNNDKKSNGFINKVNEKLVDKSKPNNAKKNNNANDRNPNYPVDSDNDF